MKHVRDLMTIHPMCCFLETSLVEVAQMMEKNDCGGLPVVKNTNDKRPLGIITDRDVVCRSLAEGKDPLLLSAKDCMTRPVITVTANTRADSCCQLMGKHKIRRVPVVDLDGHICGIVSQADIARFMPIEQKAQFIEEVSEPTSSEHLSKEIA